MDLSTRKLPAAVYSLLTDGRSKKFQWFWESNRYHQILWLQQALILISNLAAGGGKSIVDANMPLLRKRLKRLKLKERNNEMSTPDGGERIQWEEELSPSYQCKIWEPICLLHNYLMPLASLSVMALVVAASVLFVWGIIVIKIHPCGFGACSLAILS